jgi:hypothetical protein
MQQSAPLLIGHEQADLVRHGFGNERLQRRSAHVLNDARDHVALAADRADDGRLTRKPEEMIFLGKVIYGEAATKVRHAGVVDSAIWVVKQAYGTGSVKAEDELEFLREMAAEMYVEILWNSVTSKAEKWSHQSETRLLAVNDLRNPKIKIHNADQRPRVELPQPLLKKNAVEVMLGPKTDDAAKLRVRNFLDGNQLQHVPVTIAAAQLPEPSARM